MKQKVYCKILAPDELRALMSINEIDVIQLKRLPVYLGKTPQEILLKIINEWVITNYNQKGFRRGS